DDKAVYLALKQAKPFQGKRGKLYLERRIKQVINKRRSLDKVKKLLDQHGMDALCASVKVLLGDGVFASTDKAKTRFPELFPELPTGGQKREVFEDEVQNETTGLQPAKQVRQGENEPSKEAMKEPHGMQPHLMWIRGTDQFCLAAVQPQEPPVHLPFGAQHKLMVQLQEYLEHACYAYGQRKMQETLRERGWDCVEAVELHSWMEEFLHRYKTFETESSSEVLEKLFQSVADIRHTAVRRTHTDSVGIKKFLLDAEHLVRLLQVEEYLGVINKLRLHIERVLIELGQNNRFLQVRAEEKKSEIAVERAMLDQLEKATIAETRKGVEEYQALAGSEVMKAI
ncbi:hypothetical protein B0J13DRAFT_416398, partial [Dactylonectria estremocensis]